MTKEEYEDIYDTIFVAASIIYQKIIDRGGKRYSEDARRCILRMFQPHLDSLKNHLEKHNIVIDRDFGINEKFYSLHTNVFRRYI